MLNEANRTPSRFTDSEARVAAASLSTDASFRALLRSRSGFVLWTSLALLTFNLLQPVLSVFTPWLDRRAFGELSIGWVYAFAQFVVPLMLLHLYASRAWRYDAASLAIRDRLLRGGG